MVEEPRSKLFFLGIFPKCPYYKSVINVALIAILIILGTVGLYYLHLWVAVGYAIYASVFYFFLMPWRHCQYCYYKVKEPTAEKLLPKEKWVESCLQKHVACGKKWSANFALLWFIPIIGIVISFFLAFDIVALLSLIGFVVTIALMAIHLQRKICPTCAIEEECHAAF